MGSARKCNSANWFHGPRGHAEESPGRVGREQLRKWEPARGMEALLVADCYHALAAASFLASRRTESPEQTLPLLTAYKSLSILL